jgi:hypothetical protein
MALLAMDCATKEYRDWKECWIYMALWMQTQMEIWIVGELQEDMCLTFLDVKVLTRT